MAEWKAFESKARGQSGPTGKRCGVALFLETLDPEGVAAVKKALANRDVSAAGLERALIEELGSSPSKWSIGNHRRGDCRCNR